MRYCWSGIYLPCIPLIYEFDDNLQPVKNYYLADKAELEAAQKAVANQGKAKS
jgi:2,3-bisphosphoglycerate-dependent phosphoglycerate mutase